MARHKNFERYVGLTVQLRDFSNTGRILSTGECLQLVRTESLTHALRRQNRDSESVQQLKTCCWVTGVGMS